MSGFVRRDPVAVRPGALLGLVIVAGLLATTAAGCATGDDGVMPRGGDAGQNPRFDAGTGPVDAGPAPTCVPACPTDQVCREGVCVSGELDADEDGVPAAIDCDDADPGVGRSIESDCTSSCGAGLRLCMDGVWGECDAPTTCDCADGSAPRTMPCGRCGTQRQVCVGGTWVNDGACTGEGICTPGATDTGGACGCGTEQRTCNADCTWGAFTCVGGGAGECTPGQTEMEEQACGNCGRQTRTRTCDSTCGWGAWSGYTTCSGGGVCSPGATRTGCDRNSAGVATGCGVEVCSSSCNWGSCQLASGAQCMSGMGSNFQCCTPTGGGSGWSFCNASTCRWYTCESHSC